MQDILWFYLEWLSEGVGPFNIESVFALFGEPLEHISSKPRAGQLKGLNGFRNDTITLFLSWECFNEKTPGTF